MKQWSEPTKYALLVFVSIFSSMPLARYCFAEGSSDIVNYFNKAEQDSGALPVNSQFSIALGMLAQAQGASSIAIGPITKTYAPESVSIGDSSTAVGEAVSIGHNAYAGSDSVAIGSCSTTRDYKSSKTNGYLMTKDDSPDSTALFSVGSESMRRRIIHLRSGSAPDDAVNVEQLQALNDKIDSSLRESAHNISNEIDGLKNNEGVIQSRINHLDKKLERALATSSAISGLYQPYSLRKHNFTASVGGYRSNVAIAVGSGYRFSESFSSKCGIAFSKHGGIMYNAAMNVEW